MDLQQVFFYEFRLRPQAAPVRSEEPRFFTGVLHGIMFSFPVWALIAWGVRALTT
jgi:hypothetical protein